MCMHAQEVFFFQIRYIKKPVTFFKNGCEKIVFITKCKEKNCLKRITLQKKLSASPKNGKIMVRPLMIAPPIRNLMLAIPYILSGIFLLDKIIFSKSGYCYSGY